MDGRLALQDRQIYSCANIMDGKLLPETNNIVFDQYYEEFSSAHNFHSRNDFGGLSYELVNELPANENGLSSEEIMTLAGTQYMQASSAHAGFDHASYFAIPAMPTEKQKGLELAHLLLTSAEMIGNKQYDQASRLVSQCKNFSSQLGNPVQRLAYYFSGALQHRIDRETLGELNKAPKPAANFAYNVDDDFDKREFYCLVARCTRMFPYGQVLQFTAVQAILEAVGNAKRIHVIDLGIRTGCQWTILIQSLALRASFSSSYPSSNSLELLKITAVGTNAQELKDSGKMLCEFARSMAVPFSYKIAEISKAEDINEGLFNIKSGEAVAVYASMVLRSLLYDPVLLVNLANVIKKLRPDIMVNAEVEAQHNSSSFVNRFIEVLFYYSKYFDSLEVILPERNDLKRLRFEDVFCWNHIRNMIACEGEDRRVRHVKMDVWRCFFKQAGFEEMGFSYQAWYQARLILNQVAHGECYCLEQNGSAISVGWKGTPLHTLSAWTCKGKRIAW